MYFVEMSRVLFEKFMHCCGLFTPFDLPLYRVVISDHISIVLVFYLARAGLDNPVIYRRPVIARLLFEQLINLVNIL